LPKPEDDFATPVTPVVEEQKPALTATEQNVLNKLNALTTNDNAAVNTNGTAAPSSTYCGYLCSRAIFERRI